MFELLQAVLPFLGSPEQTIFPDASADALPPTHPSTQPSSLEIASILENRKKLEMWEQCCTIKTDLMNLERVQSTFLRAEFDFPTVTGTLSLSDAIDEALLDNVSGEKAKKGMNPHASSGEIQCYRDWLSRAYRGTKWHQENGPLSPLLTQTFKRRSWDLDLANSLYRVCEKHYWLNRSS